MKGFRWGIVGTGYIAGNFACSMQQVDDAACIAITGTSLEKANRFAEEHGFGQGFDNFGEMLAQAKLDVVYIAVPNHLHYDFVMQALDAGVNVLCEKPMADNMPQLQRMMNKAREKNVCLMEGMWTRCFPAVRKAAGWIEDGRIGKVRSVRADFGLRSAPDWQNWKTSAQASAGALRDVGVYSVAMAFLGFGEAPESIASSCVIKNGADTHQEMMFRYTQDRAAYLTGSFEMITDHHAYFYGNEGMIVLGDRFWCPTYAELYAYDGGDIFEKRLLERFEEKYEPFGFQYEIAHVQDCIRSGKKESDFYSLAESAAIMEVTDTLRREWGVRYPSDPA